MNIDNLYKNQKIMLFKQCYAMEKIHGTSAHIQKTVGGRINFFSGGSQHASFLSLFNQDELIPKLLQKSSAPFTIYGEAYGGKMQGMSKTYGSQLRFVAFEVKIGDSWLNVPKAQEFVVSLGLDFVFYKLINTNIEEIDAERDAPSEQAKRLGMGDNCLREGVVLRPLEEVVFNSGDRAIAKHKADAFKETNTPRKIVDPTTLEVLTKAKDIATEWVTRERLNHILTGNNIELKIENIGKVIPLMQDDITREAKGEVVLSDEAVKEISRATALLIKQESKYQVKEQ
jgi:hypothetical protein